MRFLPPLFVLLLCTCVRAQSSYTLYLTGSETDVVTAPTGGVCMMGGRTENDNAMRWFLARAAGGDVVVLRASGSDGYNDYFYEQLGVNINSVRTLVFDSGADAGAEEVIEAVANAEAIWFAGGDQAKYVEYWRGTPLDSTLRVVINERNAVVGGTSAGMAILGGYYFTAANGTVSSEEALADPFNEFMTIESERFLSVPGLEFVITDSHFSERDRQGRFATFIAHASARAGRPVTGIACDEYTAVCLTPAGMASVYGTPGEEDYAYFINVGCPGESSSVPDVFAAGLPVGWGSEENGGLGLARVSGDENNPPVFCLPDFSFVDGGWEWQHWWIENGNLMARETEPFTCLINSVAGGNWTDQITIYPNPAPDQLSVSTDWPVTTARIIDVNGRVRHTIAPADPLNFTFTTSTLSPGSYYLLLSAPGKRARQRFIVP